MNPVGKNQSDWYVHESSIVDPSCHIGKGTKVWHFSHVMKGTVIGEACSFGQSCHIGPNVVIGNRVKVQNNVSIYTGTILEDDVFLGPSCVLTNIKNPRAQISRHSLFEKTLLRRGATVGANATIVCGTTIGRYAFVGAGTVVTKDVPDYGLVIGNPGRLVGWVSRHGHRLKDKDAKGYYHCPESGFRYLQENERLRCVDLHEEKPLPENMRVGHQSYDDFK